MNPTKPILSILIVSILMFGMSCEKNTDPELNDFEIVDVSGETDWDYWIISNTDNSFFLIDEFNSIPEKVFFKPSQDHPGYPIFLDEIGLPKRAMIDGYIFLFDNFSGNTFDLAIINPLDEIEVLRDIESDYDFDTYRKSTSSVDGWSEVFKIAKIATSVAACGIGVALAPVGIGVPIAAIGCGAAALQIAAELLPDDQEILGFSATTIGSFATAVGCVTSAGITCALGVASEAFSIAEAYAEEAEEKSQQIDQAVQIMNNTSNSLNIAANSIVNYDKISTSSYKGYLPNANHTIDGIIKLSYNHWSAPDPPAWISYEYNNVVDVNTLIIYNGSVNYGDLKYHIDYLDKNDTWQILFSSAWINESVSGVEQYQAEDDGLIYKHVVSVGKSIKGIKISIDDSNFPSSHLWRTVITEVEIYKSE